MTLPAVDYFYEFACAALETLSISGLEAPRWDRLDEQERRIATSALSAVLGEAYDHAAKVAQEKGAGVLVVESLSELARAAREGGRP